MDRRSNVEFFEVFNLNVKIWVIVSVKNIGEHIKHFFQIIWTILLCIIYNVHWLMAAILLS